jgi:hypothetical protein
MNYRSELKVRDGPQVVDAAWGRFLTEFCTNEFLTVGR